DDDPTADGIRHCHTAGASLGPGQSETFFIDLSAPDSKSLMGMNAGPPSPGRAGMQAMAGSGTVNPEHIVAFQIFLHQPASPVTLQIRKMRLLASLPATDLYNRIADSFGQFTRADWPGKVHSLPELAQHRTEEERDLAAHPVLPGRDIYGGW